MTLTRDRTEGFPTIPRGQRVHVRNFIMNNERLDKVEGTYLGKIHHGPEIGKHWVRINTVMIPVERRGIIYEG